MASRQETTEQFLRRRDCILQKSRHAEATHTRMDGKYGGCFHVPWQCMDEFYNAYGNDISHGRDLFFIEKNTDVFRLHFDVDFPTLTEEARTLEFCKVLHAAVAEYFEEPKWAVVCAVLDEQRQQRKAPGLHVIFPEANVDSQTALTIWAGVVERCQQKLSWCADDWAKVLDLGVLRHKGSLRMVGSKKSVKCGACGDGAGRGNCTQCHFQGRVTCDKIYWPWRVLHRDDAVAEAKLADLRANEAHAVKTCSIRTPFDAPSQDFKTPPGAPLPGKLRRDRNKDRPDEILRRDGCAFPTKAKKELLVLQPEVLESLLRSIRAYHERFAELLVLDVVKVGGGGGGRGGGYCCWVRVRGFNDRYCLNKGSAHNSSQVYFCVSFRGLTQKCFSKKPTAYAGGCACDAFEGPARPVSELVARALLADQAPPEEAPGAAGPAPAPAAAPPPRAAAPPASSSSGSGRKRGRGEAGEAGDGLVCYAGFYHMLHDDMI